MVDPYILKTLIQILAQGDIGSYVIDLEKEKKINDPLLQPTKAVKIAMVLKLHIRKDWLLCTQCNRSTGYKRVF